MRMPMRSPTRSELAFTARPAARHAARAAGDLPPLGNRLATTEKLIAVGASTGGTEAIKEFLVPMPADAPAILVTQHMPEAFTKSFAARLDSLCKITVCEAEHNQRVLPGHAYIAPGHSHLLLKRSGANYLTELSQAEPVNHHRPSVEVLFRSVAQCAAANAIGVMLTGMGKDGAAGMLEMRQAGAYNLAQDEASCVVFGMPREAIAVGAVHEVVGIQDMAQTRAGQTHASQQIEFLPGGCDDYADQCDGNGWVGDAASGRTFRLQFTEGFQNGLHTIPAGCHDPFHTHRIVQSELSGQFGAGYAHADTRTRTGSRQVCGIVQAQRNGAQDPGHRQLRQTVQDGLSRCRT